jgi:hypothetical protein
MNPVRLFYGDANRTAAVRAILLVIPSSYETWRTGTGLDYFFAGIRC